MTAEPADPVVYVVDDDAIVRDGLILLLESADIPALAFDSAEAFLRAALEDRPACLVLDMRMPGMSGLELQTELGRRGIALPTVFLTAHGDIPMTVQALKAGAFDFLTKPVDGTVLLDVVREALKAGTRLRAEQAATRAERARLETLTSREREILDLAITGVSNKVIARQLGISFRTVEAYRSRILHKTGTESLMELAHRLAGGSSPEVSS